MSQAQEAPTTTPIGPLARRVVTGLGQDGKAKIIYDDTEGSVMYVTLASTFLAQ